MKKRVMPRRRLIVTVKNDNGEIKRVIISPLRLKNIKTASIIDVSLISRGKFIPIPIKGLSNKDIRLKINRIIHHSPIWPPGAKSEKEDKSIIIVKNIRTDYE